MVDHEAICVVKGLGEENVMTAAYRSGERNSVFDSVLIGPEGREISRPEAQMLDVSQPARDPCVRLSIHGSFEMTNPDEVYALAQWLVAASMQLATDREARDD